MGNQKQLMVLVVVNWVRPLPLQNLLDLECSILDSRSSSWGRPSAGHQVDGLSVSFGHFLTILKVLQISAVTRQICAKQSSKERQRNFQSNGATGVQILWLDHFWVSRLVTCVMSSLALHPSLHPSMLPLTLFLLGFSSYAMLVLPLPNLPLHQLPFNWETQTFKPCIVTFVPRDGASPQVDGLPPGSGGSEPWYRTSLVVEVWAARSRISDIGPPWPSRSGPLDPQYRLPDLRGLGVEMPNPRYRNPNVWLRGCRAMPGSHH